MSSVENCSSASVISSNNKPTELQIDSVGGSVLTITSNNVTSLEINNTADSDNLFVMNPIYISDIKLSVGETITLPAGSDATVVNSGTSRNVILNFGIPGSPDLDINGAASTIIHDNLTPNRAIISSTDGKVIISDITITELGYLSGSSSNLQDQINSIVEVLPSDATTANPVVSKAYVDGINDSLSQRIDNLDTYTYTQSTAATVWSITHDLGRYPSCTIVDSAGTVVVGDIDYIDENNISVTFNAAFKGIAYLN